MSLSGRIHDPKNDYEQHADPYDLVVKTGGTRYPSSDGKPYETTVLVMTETVDQGDVLLALSPTVARRVAALLIACAEDIESQQSVDGKAAKVEFVHGPEVKLPNEVMRELRKISHAVTKPERDFQVGINRVTEQLLAEGEWAYRMRYDERLSIRQVADLAKEKFGYSWTTVQAHTRIESYRAFLEQQKES